MTAWDFETRNMPASLFDEATIIAPAKEDTYKIFNFHVKGKFNQGEFDAIQRHLEPEDRKSILLNATHHAG